MPQTVSPFGEGSRLRALLDHFGVIEDPREPWKVAPPCREVLLLVVCGTIADCDDYDHIAAWGEAHLPFLREILPYHHGVPGGRWLTLLMNRIDPGLFSACFTAWVRETWPERPDFVAIDGKTSRRSHDRSATRLPAPADRLEVACDLDQGHDRIGPSGSWRCWPRYRADRRARPRLSRAKRSSIKDPRLPPSANGICRAVVSNGRTLRRALRQCQHAATAPSLRGSLAPSIRPSG